MQYSTRPVTPKMSSLIVTNQRRQLKKKRLKGIFQTPVHNLGMVTLTRHLCHFTYAYVDDPYQILFNGDNKITRSRSSNCWT